MTTGAAAAAPPRGLSIFERWLSLWVALCIVVGIAVGYVFPVPMRALGAMEVAHVNIPVGALIWLMIVPISL